MTEKKQLHEDDTVWDGKVKKGEKGRNGGARRGAGRPKGSTNIYSHESVKKLQQLGFDPIEMMVQKYNEIEETIQRGDVKVGTGAHAQLVATQQKIINDLMQYGYKKIPEKVESEVTNKKPLAIKLTTSKSKTPKDDGD